MLGIEGPGSGLIRSATSRAGPPTGRGCCSCGQEVSHGAGRAALTAAGSRPTSATPTSATKSGQSCHLSPVSGLWVTGTLHQRGFSHRQKGPTQPRPAEVAVQKRLPLRRGGIGPQKSGLSHKTQKRACIRRLRLSQPNTTDICFSQFWKLGRSRSRC